MGFSLAVLTWQALVSASSGLWTVASGFGFLAPSARSTRQICVQCFWGSFWLVLQAGRNLERATQQACVTDGIVFSELQLYGCTCLSIELGCMSTSICYGCRFQVQSNVRHGTSRGCTGFACHRVRKWEGFSASTQSLLWPTSGLLILCRPMAGLWPWDVKISSSRHILQPYSQDQTARARLICMGSGS